VHPCEDLCADRVEDVITLSYRKSGSVYESRENSEGGERLENKGRAVKCSVTGSNVKASAVAANEAPSKMACGSRVASEASWTVAALACGVRMLGRSRQQQHQQQHQQHQAASA